MRITCPAGHEWEAPAQADIGLLSGADHCPICTAWKKVPRTAEMGIARAPLTEALPIPTDWPLVPGYELLRELGRGGMGIVYLARQTSLDRLVALKMILDPQRAGPRERGRFHNEVQAIAQLQHPNIVQVFEVGEVNDCPYFSMEYISGGSLDDMLKQRTFGPRAAAELLELLARAMGYAHQAGIVHRDLKPANVLVQRVGASDPGETLDGYMEPLRTGELPTQRGSNTIETTGTLWRNLTPKISDFGLARRLETDPGVNGPRLTESNMVVGTSGYMSPEQALGYSRDVGPGADVYALGAILYETLTGRPPFVGNSWIETLHQVRFSDPVPLRYLQPGVPRDLETICLKCLQKDALRRYITATELAEDLRRFLNGESILARPAPVWERVAKWVKRRPLAASLTFTTIVATGAIVTLSIGYMLSLQQLNDDLVLQVNRAEQGEMNATLNAVEAEKQKQIAIKEKQLALEKVLEARDTVNQYFQVVSQNELLDQPGLKELRQVLLQKALAAFTRFVNDKTTDPELRTQYGEIHAQLARVKRELGKPDEAIEHYRDAKKTYADLLASHPGNPKYLLDQSTCDYDIGVIQQGLTNLQEAEKAYRNAYESQRRLVDQYPEDWQSKHALGMTCNARGLLAVELGQSAGAEAYYREAIVLRQALDKKEPDNGFYQYDLAISYNNMGLLQVSIGNYLAAAKYYRSARELLSPIISNLGNREYLVQARAATYSNQGLLHTIKGEWSEAQKSFEEANLDFKELHRRHFNVGQYTNDYARCQQNLGNVYRCMGKLEAARRRYELVLNLREELLNDNPAVPLYESELAGTLNNLGVVLLMLNENNEAARHLERALKLQVELSKKYPKVVRYQSELADTSNNLGLLATARKEFDEADVHFSSALEKYKKLLRDNDALQDDLRVTIGGTYLNRGHLWSGQRKYAHASQWYEQAIKTLQPILLRQPQHAQAIQNLRDAYLGRATMYSMQMKDTEALNDLTEAMRLGGGNQPRMKFAYAATLARLKRPAEAVKEIESAYAGSLKDGEAARLAAGCYALCAEAAEEKKPASPTEFTSYAQKSLEYLERAEKDGYFKVTERVAQLSKDRDFQALRTFDPFLNFLKRLEPRPK